MSHFEYVSVAIALVHALAIGRLLSGLSPALDSSRRYSVHVAWIAQLLLVTVTLWWVFWRLKEVAWTPPRFLWALSIPALVFVRASVLVGESPGSIQSFRDHFFEQRVRFFSLGVIMGVQVALAPWVLGVVPWLSRSPAHPSAAGIILLSLVGLAFRSSAAHAVLVSASVLLALLTLFMLGAAAPAA